MSWWFHENSYQHGCGPTHIYKAIRRGVFCNAHFTFRDVPIKAKRINTFLVIFQPSFELKTLFRHLRLFRHLINGREAVFCSELFNNEAMFGKTRPPVFILKNVSNVLVSSQTATWLTAVNPSTSQKKPRTPIRTTHSQHTSLESPYRNCDASH